LGGHTRQDVSGPAGGLWATICQFPGADSQVGCVQLNGAIMSGFLGNEVHNAGIPPTVANFTITLFTFSTDSNHLTLAGQSRQLHLPRHPVFHSFALCSPSCGAAIKPPVNLISPLHDT